MAIPFMLFQPEKPHCPSCFAVWALAEDVCVFCGANFASVDAKFAWDPPPLTDILDPDKRLTRGGRRVVDGALQNFARSFTGFRAYVCLLSLPPGVDSREFGFWYFNSARDTEGDRTRSLMLLIDRTARVASVTTGYAIDPLVGDLTIGKVLQLSRDYFEASDYAGGVKRFFGALIRHMRKMYPEYLSMAAKSSANAFRPPI